MKTKIHKNAKLNTIFHYNEKDFRTMVEGIVCDYLERKNKTESKDAIEVDYISVLMNLMLAEAAILTWFILSYFFYFYEL